MRQVSRVLSTYTADVSGVCSALYEMGGMVIMHDASGCNSTYNTHDEPRWYDMPSMVYVSGLSELEAVMGDDDKLLRDVERAAKELHPRFVAIAGTPIPMMMGTDFKGIARLLEKRLGIPVFGFATNGTHSYVSGVGMALAQAAKRFCLPKEQLSRTDKGQQRTDAETVDGTERPCVNLLGVTPLDLSVTGNVEALKEVFESAGYRVKSCWAMGSDFEELIRAGEADVNVAVSVSGIETAIVLEEMYGTPWVLGLPAGMELTRKVLEAVDLAAAAGKNQLALALEPDGSAREERMPQTLESDEHISEKHVFSVSEKAVCREIGKTGENHRKTYIIGEWVWAMALRYSLITEYGYDRVSVICPLESEELFADRLLAGREERILGVLDVAARAGAFLEDEDQIEERLKDAELVIADPIYRRALPKDRTVDFMEFPHEGYSGRIYRKDIPIFIGRQWNQWFENRE